MAKSKTSDFALLISTILLVFIGIIMVFSSSYPDAFFKKQDGYYFLKRHLMFSGLGFVTMFFFARVFNYRRLKKLAVPIFIGCLVLTSLLFTPLGMEANGAKRWVDLGITTFQPSEAMKLGAIILLAKILSDKKGKIRNFTKGVIPSLFVIGIACGSIIIQKDLSTSAVLGLTLVFMLFIAGMKIIHLTGLGLIGLVGVYFAVKGEDFRMKRIISFTDPFKYKSNEGWQVVQSLYALGSGGIFGLGLGQSRQKHFYIPEPYNDFIFSIIGEELGFVGSITVMLLFLLIIWRGIRAAINAKDLFGCLLASGIVSLITVQTLVHIAVVTSSMPPTGIPLPFVSFGGTALLIFMAAIGILLNISQTTDIDRR